MAQYHPDAALDLYLESTVESWDSSRDVWWNSKVQNGHISLGRLADELAEALIMATDELIVPHRTEGILEPLYRERFQAIHELLEKTELRRWALERLEIHVARQFCTGSGAMAQRCYDLSKLVLDRRPNRSVLQYLRRLSRCYIAGFDSEAVVMCRAILENALSDVFQRRRLEPDAKMRVRLDQAQELQWISAAARRKAWTVWTRGNTAVHHDPEAVGDALSTIEMTLSVLQELYVERT